MQNEKILVVGATGRVGGAAVKGLLEAGFRVRALVRRPQRGEPLRALGAEVAVGNVSDPDTLGPAVQGCSGVFSALDSAGVRRFVYSSVHLADHPLAQKVGAFREKARFEEELLAAEDVSSTILRPAIFMETLHMMLRGSVAFVPGRQRRPVSWIATRDIARAAIRAFQADILGRYEIAGPDVTTFDGAFERLARARGKGIQVLHVPLIAMRLSGRASPCLRELANMMAFFDAVGFAVEPSHLRDTFGVHALTIEEWVRDNGVPGVS